MTENKLLLVTPRVFPSGLLCPEENRCLQQVVSEAGPPPPSRTLQERGSKGAGKRYTACRMKGRTGTLAVPWPCFVLAFFGKMKLFQLILVHQGLSLTWTAGERLCSPGRDGKIVRGSTWISLQVCTVTLHIYPWLNLSPEQSVERMATLSSSKSPLWVPCSPLTPNKNPWLGRDLTDYPIPPLLWAEAPSTSPTCSKPTWP